MSEVDAQTRLIFAKLDYKRAVDERDHLLTLKWLEDARAHCLSAKKKAADEGNDDLSAFADLCLDVIEGGAS